MLAKHSVLTMHQLPANKSNVGAFAGMSSFDNAWQNPSRITKNTAAKMELYHKDVEFRAREEVKAFLMLNICSYPSFAKSI